MKKRKAHGTKKALSGIKALLLGSGIGAFIGLALFIAFILIISAFCLMSNDPHRFVTPLCFFALYSSAFFAGLIAYKKSNSSALLCGALCGVFLTFVFLVFAAILRIGSSASENYFSPIFKILVIPSSCLGGAVGAYSPKKSKKRQKRR